jgi:hypothetical protein
MSSLVEFVAPVAAAGNRDRSLAVLYYAQFVEGHASMTAPELRDRLVDARVPKARRVNVADVLAHARHLVDSVRAEGTVARSWHLTVSGKEHVEALLGLSTVEPEVLNDVAALRARSLAIKDDVVRGYVEEAILCLQVNALRATVVFLWAGAMRKLQEDVFASHQAKAITASIQKHDPKTRPLDTVDDFAGVRDKFSLLAMRDLGRIDKGEWATLEEALSLRNRCGHPTRYRPGSKKVASFVEDLTGIVFR